MRNITSEIPFEIPNSWCWVRLKNIGTIVGGGTPDTSNKNYWDGDIVWITPANMGKLKSLFVENSDRKITSLGLVKSSAQLLPKNSIIMSSRAPIGYLAINKTPACTSQGCKSLIPLYEGGSEYIVFALKARMSSIKSNGSGNTFSEISGKDFSNIIIPLPPLKEQERIVEEYKTFADKIDSILYEYHQIVTISNHIKLKLLDHFFGDNSSYKSYYGKEFKFGEILKYEQPTKYIVKTTNYSDKYATPVLTAGKSYILGYTDETDGIYHLKNGEKVIIFDDFTTSSHLVDFDFKVKSSAMKILTITDANIFNIEYIYYLLQILKIDTSNHKRYWISEYANKIVRIHTRDEQNEIVRNIHLVYKLLSNLNSD